MANAMWHEPCIRSIGTIANQVYRRKDGIRNGAFSMLILSRRVGEQIVIPHCDLTVTVLDAGASRVRLGVDAPARVSVRRGELCPAVSSQNNLEAEKAMKSLRILIADPDAYLTRSYREYFDRSGATVSTAPTALACLDRLRDFSPDVLILEATLLWGGADGVLARMQEEPALRPSSVILTTQVGDRGLLYRLSPYKVDDYQVKPLSPRELLKRVYFLRIARGASAKANRAAAARR
jgi:carbon storage regulator CsrA